MEDQNERKIGEEKDSCGRRVLSKEVCKTVIICVRESV